MWGCIPGVLHGQLLCAQRRAAKRSAAMLKSSERRQLHRNASSAGEQLREHVHYLTLTDLSKKLSGWGFNVTLSPKDMSPCDRKVKRAHKCEI